MFGVAQDATACLTVATQLVADIDRAFARALADGAPLACRAGCAFCCHQRVTVLPHEALALAQRLRELPETEREELERRLRTNAAIVDGMTAEQHRSANLACAFLRDGRCRVYAARPSVCAAYHSLSRSRCEHAFAHPQHQGTPHNARPALLELQEFCDATIAATEAAARDAGLSVARAELHTALRALLDQRPG